MLPAGSVPAVEVWGDKVQREAPRDDQRHA